ncbi:hypothetical protein DRV85_03615 [Rhodosalinus halophilus]|uniref:Uncharacterized protein n=1 Tax=Rhodosalinus halophilus TaxID=2259333 RepID=A0A365UBL1_9RHOB|nr:hypothetical protein [Rhodosalinus halophilus]RBI86533.1 hypothetical protein DRV85_03615 [Rhodosalinus halophilus]
MFLELIATVFAGLAAAGVVLLVNRGLGGRLPRWLAPVTAGAAMLAATISSEYSWFGRTAGALPEAFAVIETVESSAIWRPWTYLAPFTERFVALDGSSVRQNAVRPEERLADLYFFGRWAPVRQLEIRVDCARGARALPGDGTGGEVVWQEVGADDAIVAAVCGEAAA